MRFLLFYIHELTCHGDIFISSARYLGFCKGTHHGLCSAKIIKNAQYLINLVPFFIVSFCERSNFVFFFYNHIYICTSARPNKLLLIKQYMTSALFRATVTRPNKAFQWQKVEAPKL